MNPFAGIAVVLGALGLLIGAVNVGQRRGRVGAEGARKLVHIGMGCVCLTFPLLFTAAWPVWALAALAALALGALRFVPFLRREIGGVLHDVGRTSWGEVYFPLGVAIVFTLARGETRLFVVPVALLTFADAAGALVGRRWGRRKFATLEGQKSAEGSAAVGVVALACAVVPLLATGLEWRAAWVIGAALGLFAMMVEAISWRGLDNVFLPLAAFAQLSVDEGLAVERLVVKLAVLVTLAGVGLVWRRGSVADASARVGAALAMYFFWAVGGWTWLVAPLLLLASYVRLMPSVPGGPPRHNLVAVICVSSAGLVCAVAAAFAPDARWWWLFTLSIAAHQAMIAIVRFSQGRPHWSRGAWWAVGVAQAAGLHGLAFWLIDRGRTIGVARWAECTAWLAVVAAGFVMSERDLQRPERVNRRWWKQGIAALAISAGGYVLTNL